MFQKSYFFYIFFLVFLMFSAIGMHGQSLQKNKLTNFVNPFIGTGGHGHTYPGATMPFGMVQLSPDTRLDGWDGCSGYHYSDNYIYGFSHTHLSGTGVSDYGDILLMPTDQVIFNNGADGKKGYRAHFSHKNESASPGFYKVHLDKTNIDVELTVTERAGMHKYKFPPNGEQIVILDLEHRDKLLDGKINIVNGTEVSGHRFSSAWATDQRLFYYIKFSRPFTKSEEPSESSNSKKAFVFSNKTSEPLLVSVGISAVDIEGAKKNLGAEIGNKTFQQIKKEAQEKWEKQLSKIEVENNDNDQKTIFYTALYHTMIAPNLYQDVDGRYRGMDLKIHQTKDFDYYTVFSLWDTYRAVHPLYTIIEQDRTNDFINTFLAKYDEGGIMPIWDLSANYTGCMIGYHAVPVIADAYLKEIRGYDAEKALNAMKHSAQQDELGLKYYKANGFIPVEEESESVSKTLEYAFDDWTIAQMAQEMNEPEVYKTYIKRAQYYKNVFDPQTNFMRGRFRNTWSAPFDPYEVNFNYTEANAWQYSLYAPQDISGLMDLMGGKKALEKHLDDLFSAKNETSGRDQADITGLIGQYAHGNEPSHHMAYLYNFVNKPAKTQKMVNEILTNLYKNTPDGISGNEDCGQMSAWYVFGALGFYPVTPGSNQYIIGSPLVESAVINLGNGKKFEIKVENFSSENKYIQNATLNGKKLNRTFLNHSEIAEGGNLNFIMGNKSSNWGTEDGEQPETEIKENLIVAAPFIAKGETAFKNETEITLESASKESFIYFNLNGGPFKKYTEPFKISEEKILKTYAEKDVIKSAAITTKFHKIDPNLGIKLDTEYASQYNGGGNNVLIDGILGGRDFRTGAWQGYQNKDLVATVDLGISKTVKTVNVNFLQDQRSWIFYPTEVELYVSENGTDFELLSSEKIDAGKRAEETEIKNMTFNKIFEKARFVKIVAKNFGALPNWHLGKPYDGKAWLFVDEIEVK